MLLKPLYRFTRITHSVSLNRFGQFLTWTISSPDQNETKLDMSLVENFLVSTDGKLESAEQRLGKKIILRNVLLEIFLTLVGAGKEELVNERLAVVLGVGGLVAQGRWFDSHRGQAKFSACPVWMHSQSKTTNIIFT
jgi:hypothetical protein